MIDERIRLGIRAIKQIQQEQLETKTDSELIDHFARLLGLYSSVIKDVEIIYGDRQTDKQARERLGIGDRSEQL